MIGIGMGLIFFPPHEHEGHESGIDHEFKIISKQDEESERIFSKLFEEISRE